MTKIVAVNGKSILPVIKTSNDFHSCLFKTKAKASASAEQINYSHVTLQTILGD